MIEMIKSEGQKEQGLEKSEQSLRNPWDIIKQTDTHIVGVPEVG